MLFNESEIREIMYQTDPMLMLKLVEKIDDMSVKADINIDNIWSKELAVGTPIFIVIEAMGQSAEFMWRQSGKTGKALLIGINDLEIEEIRFSFDNVKINAKANISYRNFCKSNVWITNKSGSKIITAEIIHCFFSS